MSDDNQENNVVVEEGAPAWVVTFGDLMSLLVCFFVLLLSFSEMDKAKYKEISGSMAQAFGVQKKKKVFESPQGDKMVAKDFDQDTIATRDKKEIGRQIQKEIETSLQDDKDLVQLEIGEDKIIIRLMGESTFDSGKAQIRAQMLPLLSKIGTVLKDTKGDIIIAGHTDDVPLKGGQYKSNLGLSMARSASVADFLIQKEYIEPRRISTMGFGEYRPMESNDTGEGRKINRRVEIVLSTLPLPEVKK